MNYTLSSRFAKPQAGRSEIDVRKEYCVPMSRIVLNQSAPDFSLADYRGNAFRLSELCGQKNVLLVFNRTFT